MDENVAPPMRCGEAPPGPSPTKTPLWVSATVECLHVMHLSLGDNKEVAKMQLRQLLSVAVTGAQLSGCPDPLCGILLLKAFS